MVGLTLAEVASTTGYAQTTLSSVENHHDQPSKRSLAKWINALRINESWLNTGEGEPFAKIGPEVVQGLRTDPRCTDSLSNSESPPARHGSPPRT